MEKPIYLQIIIFGLLVTFQLGKAQPFTIQTQFELPEIRNGDADWCDYDMDGDLDILLSGKVGHIEGISKIYKNTLPDSIGFVEQISLPVSEVIKSAVAWGDANNDGYPDIYLCGITQFNEDENVILINNGNETFTKLENDSIMVSNSNLLKLGWCDFNNDGKQDIIRNAYPGSELYINSGEGYFTHKFDIPSMFYCQLAWGDYNNDGFIDVFSAEDWITTRLFRNNGDNTFTEQENTNLLDIQHGDIAWCDYDNDGDLDVFLTGYIGSYQSKLYRNNGNSTFTLMNIPFPGVQTSTISWADFNNDGLSDLYFFGQGLDTFNDSTLYINNGDNTFTDTYLLNGSVDWGDYDNDGDLDILNEGIIYRNDVEVANTPPSAPQNLSSTMKSNRIVLSWQSSEDDFTPSPALTYNIRVGTTPGGSDIVSPLSACNGYKRIPGMGNVELDTFHILQNLPEGKYYWSVQAIDNGYMAGSFASETVFQFKPTELINKQSEKILLFPNPTTEELNIVCPDFLKAEIFNLQGKLVYSSDKKVIVISNLEKGTYYVKLYRINNSVITKQLVVK